MDLDARRFINQRFLLIAAIGITLGAAIWNRIPSDQPLPVPPVPRTVRFDLRSAGNRRPDPRPTSSVPKNAATVFVGLAAQLRGGDVAELQVDGEDGWQFHELRVHYLDPRRVPAGVPLFIRISYSGTTWGDRAEAGTIKCSGILTFGANRRYNLWCGDKNDVVMTLLE